MPFWGLQKCPQLPITAARDQLHPTILKTRNRFVLNRTRGFESHHLRQQKAPAQAGAFFAVKMVRMRTGRRSADRKQPASSVCACKLRRTVKRQRFPKNLADRPKMKQKFWIGSPIERYVSMVAAQDLLKRVRKPGILLLRPLLAPLGVLSEMNPKS